MKKYAYTIKVQLEQGEKKSHQFPVFNNATQQVEFRGRSATKKAYTKILNAMGYRLYKDYIVEAHKTEHALIYHFTDDVREVDMAYFAMMNSDKIVDKPLSQICPHCEELI